MAETLRDFFTPEAGQRRRSWLNEIDGKIGETLAYYLGPQLAPRVEQAANIGALFSPGMDVQDAYTASGEMMAPNRSALDRAGAGAALAGSVAAMFMPGGVSSIRQGIDDLAEAGVRAYDPSRVDIFAGARAKTADLSALDRAQGMAEAGASRDDIWRDTGWFQGVDGKWRFEIDDSGMVNDIRGAVSEGVEAGSALPLDAVIEHPELFAAYPELASVNTRLFPKETLDEIFPGTRGGVTKSGGLVFRDDLIDIGLPAHELQHKVQNIEGFDPGGSPIQIGADRYLDLPGEYEARLVELRAGLDGELRRANPPWTMVPAVGGAALGAGALAMQPGEAQAQPASVGDILWQQEQAKRLRDYLGGVQ